MHNRNITGKYTVDDRPILFKHRDSDYEQNKLMYFDDGKYNYIGLVNSADNEGNEVWGGSNSTGFSIINSASYNLRDVNDVTELKDLEGVLMKKALQNCASVDDFEKLLHSLPKPLGVEANFGGIDALVFTGGIGENSTLVRKEVCTDMEFLGIDFDEELNNNVKGEATITKPNSKVKVFRIPTNEELVIALDTEQIVSQQNN